MPSIIMPTNKPRFRATLPPTLPPASGPTSHPTDHHILVNARSAGGGGSAMTSVLLNPAGNGITGFSNAAWASFSGQTQGGTLSPEPSPSFPLWSLQCLVDTSNEIVLYLSGDARAYLNTLKLTIDGTVLNGASKFGSGFNASPAITFWQWAPEASNLIGIGNHTVSISLT